MVKSNRKALISQRRRASLSGAVAQGSGVGTGTPGGSPAVSSPAQFGLGLQQAQVRQQQQQYQSMLMSIVSESAAEERQEAGGFGIGMGAPSKVNVPMTGAVGTSSSQSRVRVDPLTEDEQLFLMHMMEAALQRDMESEAALNDAEEAAEDDFRSLVAFVDEQRAATEAAREATAAANAAAAQAAAVAAAAATMESSASASAAAAAAAAQAAAAAAMQATAQAAQVVCPICQERYLSALSGVIACSPGCTFRLDTRGDGISLDYLGARLADVCGRHTASGCTAPLVPSRGAGKAAAEAAATAVPGGAAVIYIDSRFGVHNLVMECAVCRCREVVI